MAEKERPVVKHFHGIGEPPKGSLSAYEIGIGLDISDTNDYKTKLYTSIDGEQINPLNEVDNVLSSESKNPVQNKVITKSLSKKEDYLPMELIRKIVIGDETTYKDSDLFFYDDNDNLVKAVIATDNDGLPFHLKETYCSLMIPANDAVSTAYNFICNPYSCISLDDNGFPTNYNGYKINNTSESFSPTTTKSYQKIYSSFGDDGLAWGESTVKTSASDGSVYWRHWIGGQILSFTNMWGKISKVVRINAVVAYGSNSAIPFPDGLTITIWGRRLED